MSGSTGLTGIAAVLAAAGVNADSKDAVSRAAFDGAIASALAEGEKAGVIKAGNDATKLTADATKAANIRAMSILDHADAKGREELARHLAFSTDMSAESAVAMLAKAPKAAEQKGSRLEGTVPDPKVDANVDPIKPGEGLNAAVDRMVAAHQKRAV